MAELTEDQLIQHTYLCKKIDQVRDTLNDILPDSPWRHEAQISLSTTVRLAYQAALAAGPADQN